LTYADSVDIGVGGGRVLVPELYPTFSAEGVLLVRSRIGAVDPTGALVTLLQAEAPAALQEWLGRVSDMSAYGRFIVERAGPGGLNLYAIDPAMPYRVAPNQASASLLGSGPAPVASFTPASRSWVS
jgi:hypothetical protein